MKWILFLTALLISASQAWADSKVGDISVSPLFNGEPAIIEFHGLPMSDATSASIKDAKSLHSLSWIELSTISSGLVKKVNGLTKIRPNGAVNNLLLVPDKRFFLISISPPVMAIVPYTFKMVEGSRQGKNWHAGDVAEQLKSLLIQQKKSYGITYYLAGLQQAGLSNYVEVTRVFPNVPGVEIIADGWNEPKSSQDAQSDSIWNFKFEPYPNAPEFLQIVRR